MIKTKTCEVKKWKWKNRSQELRGMVRSKQGDNVEVIKMVHIRSETLP